MEEKAYSLFPGWKIIRKIGHGSFGAVYEIEKCDSYGEGIRSALKVISIPSSSSELEAYRDDGYDDISLTTLFKSRLQDITSEFRLMNKLKGCSNIVSYEDHAIVQHESDLGYDVFIRMELLTSLPRYYDQKFNGSQFDEETVRNLGIDICRALELCEKYQIIHRDIKPQNIFVNENGDYKLGDFGIAKTSDHTTKATKTGTYGYMAPEVYLSRPYNATVDIYSLGMVMYWMLNERRGPFLPLPPSVPTSEQSAIALERRMHGEPLPSPKNGSDRLKQIILKACSFDSKERYASPTELKHALELLLSEPSSVSGSHTLTRESSSSFSDTLQAPFQDESLDYFSQVSTVSGIMNDVAYHPVTNLSGDGLPAVSSSDTVFGDNRRVDVPTETPIVSDTLKVSSDWLEKSRTVSESNDIKKNAKDLCLEETAAEAASVDYSATGKNVPVDQKQSNKKSPSPVRLILLGLGFLLVIIVILVLICGRSCSSNNKQTSVETSETSNATIYTASPTETPFSEISAEPTADPTLKITSAPTNVPTATSEPEISTPTPYTWVWTDWSTNQPPIDAHNVETKTQYSYRDKSTTTSTSSTLSGWTYESGPVTTYGSWGTWSDWSDTPCSSSDIMEVKTQESIVTEGYTEYRYGAYWSTNSSKGSYWRHFCATLAKKKFGGDWHLQYSPWSTKRYSSSGSAGSCGCHGSFKEFSGVPDANGRKQKFYWEQSRKIDPVYKTQYCYRTRTKSNVYTFYKWGQWSSWSDTAVSSSSTRQIKTQTLYRYQK